MVFVVISSSILAMLLTTLCFSATVKTEMAKKKQLEWIRGESRYIDDELEKSLYQRYLSPVLKKVAALFSKRVSAPRNRKNAGKTAERNLRLETELRLAGLTLSAQEFSFIRILGQAGFLVIGFVVALIWVKDARIQLLVVIFTLMITVLVPRYFIKSRIKNRQLTIQNQLPNVLDVLCVSIEAGLSFDSALLKVTERFKGPLIEEFSQVYREVQMGKPRREALASLNQRSNVPELQTFISAVTQSEKFGTPMRNVLLAQAQQLRVSRRQHAEEKGMKAPIKMMLPMVVFIFPVMFIILLGPTILTIFK